MSKVLRKNLWLLRVAGLLHAFWPLQLQRGHLKLWDLWTRPMWWCPAIRFVVTGKGAGKRLAKRVVLCGFMALHRLCKCSMIFGSWTAVVFAYIWHGSAQDASKKNEIQMDAVHRTEDAMDIRSGSIVIGCWPLQTGDRPDRDAPFHDRTCAKDADRKRPCRSGFPFFRFFMPEGTPGKAKWLGKFGCFWKVLACFKPKSSRHLNGERKILAHSGVNQAGTRSTLPKQKSLTPKL